MARARSKQTVIIVAANLLLFGLLGSFFHHHAPILPRLSTPCDLSDFEASYGHSHLLPSVDDEADSCTICLFNRCASHGAPVTAQLQSVEFSSVRIPVLPGTVLDSLPARLNEARAPPAA